MKNLFSLAVAGVAFAAMSQPIYAKPEKQKKGEGRGAAAASRGQMKQQAVRQPTRNVQMPARATANVQRRAVQNSKVQAATRSRVATANRAVTRTQPSVAFGGQTRAERRERTVTDTRTGVRVERRDRDRDWDRNRDWNRDRDGDWDRGDRNYRFRRPPLTVYRGWDRDRIYTYDDHRWHWFGGAWVIVGGSPDYYYYDEPVATTYAYSSGSVVVDVQRELAREGYNPGPIDGVLGGQTRSAIAAFQQDNGLPATGRIDTALLDELGLR